MCPRRKVLAALHAPRVAPEAVFGGVADIDAPLLSVAEVAFDLLAEVVQVDHYVLEAVAREHLHDVLHHRLVHDRHKRLGQIAR